MTASVREPDRCPVRSRGAAGREQRRSRNPPAVPYSAGSAETRVRRRRRRKTVRRPGRGGRARSDEAGGGVPRGGGARRDLGHRPPRRAGRAGADASRVAELEARPAADPPRGLAPRRPGPGEGAVRGCEEGARRSTRDGGRLRDGRRARGGADLPPALRGRRLHQAGEAALDLVPDARGDSRRLRETEAREGVRPARRRGARPEPGRLARRDELLPRVHSRHRREALRGEGPDADARDARRTGAVDPRLRPRGVPRTSGLAWG